jgi:hypothetical protein
MVSRRSSIATSAAIFLARPAAVLRAFVRNASANRFWRPRVRNVLPQQSATSSASAGVTVDTPESSSTVTASQDRSRRQGPVRGDVRSTRLGKPEA